MIRPKHLIAGTPPARIRKMIEAGENEILDFKKEITSENKIAKTMVSFANNKGGVLLIGVNDNGSIHGIAKDEEIYMLEKAAAFYCKPEIHLKIDQWTIGKKTILEVIIPKGENKPYYAFGEDQKWWAYIRVKDQSLLASKVVVDVLKREGSRGNTLIKYSTKEQALLNYLREHDRINLKEFCKMVNISRWKATKIMVNLVSVGIIRIHHTEKTEFYTLS